MSDEEVIVTYVGPNAVRTVTKVALKAAPAKKKAAPKKKKK